MQGFSTSKIAEIFGHNHHYYLDRFKELGFEIRSNKINSRKYTANFDYFDEINTAEKAYWLGYIYADGYVSSQQNRKKFGIALSIKDKPQLEKLNACLDSTYPIHEYTTNGYKEDTHYCRLVVESEKLFDDLVRHGVLEHKTDILTPPSLLDELIPSFILGYFDGDGSIYCAKSKYPFYALSIVGTDAMLFFIHNFLVSRNVTSKKLKLEKRRAGQTVSYIRYGGNRLVGSILDVLYSDIPDELPLKRKRILYLNCKNRVFSRS